jgi:hypothetical protein
VDGMGHIIVETHIAQDNQLQGVKIRI